jgi:hypothetical protein
MIGGCAMLGLAIGAFATSPQPRALPRYASDMDEGRGDGSGDSSALVNISPDRGPGAIICKGCGPTLAERRMAVDNPGWDPDGMVKGTRDPVVIDYMAQEDKAPRVAVPQSGLHRLPPNIQRFANGEEGAALVAPPPPLVPITVSGPTPP